MIPVFKPNLGKEEVFSVEKVFKSGWIGNGPKVKEFEAEFLKFTKGKFAVALNSASAALHLALLQVDLKPKDEVIVPSLTFVATINPILMGKAVPVFCDVDPNTLCADPQDILKKITSRTKAIIVVHYGGHPVDLDPIIKVCKGKNITLIEDCAHASGCYYKGKHVGTLGDFGCFSFAAIKNLTTGDGGMLLGKNRAKIEKAKTLAWSGISSSTWDRVKGTKLNWKYNVKDIGWKYQMSDVSAAIGIVQLAKLKKNNLIRKKITERYNCAFRKLSWLEVPVVKAFAQSSHHNYVIKVPEGYRDKLSNYLAEKGIATSVHYVPAHHYSLYSSYKTDLPVTEEVWKKILLLPIYPDLSRYDQEYILDTVKKFKP